MTIQEVETGVIKFIPTDTAIAEMRSQYMALKVNGIDDKEGLKAVHDARMIVKGKRTEVEKRRVELNKDALVYQRGVNAEAKRITALLTPIEEHLQHEEDIVKREQERIAAEEAARQAATTKSRMEKLAAVGASVYPTEVQMWTDEDFAAELAKATDAFNAKKAAEEAERQARAEEAERNRIESERLAYERRKMEAAQAELDRQRAELEAEKQRHAAAAVVNSPPIQESPPVTTEPAPITPATTETTESADVCKARRPWRVKVGKLADKFAAVEIPTGPVCNEMRDQVVAAIAECVEKIRSIIRED